MACRWGLNRANSPHRSIGDYRCAVDLASGRGVVELADHRVQLACDLAVKPLVVAEEDPQYLWQGLCEVKLEELLG